MNCVVLCCQLTAGWKLGEAVDEEAKTHPLLKPYKALNEKVLHCTAAEAGVAAGQHLGTAHVQHYNTTQDRNDKSFRWLIIDDINQCFSVCVCVCASLSVSVCVCVCVCVCLCVCLFVCRRERCTAGQ